MANLANLFSTIILDFVMKRFLIIELTEAGIGVRHGVCKEAEGGHGPTAL
jgi:hypothetical protein